jgi:signal peptide peptidase SppA
MNPIDFSKGQGWLIRPESFEILVRKFIEFNPEKVGVDFEKQMTAYRSNGVDSQDLYDLKDGIAIIPIIGPLSKRMSFFSFLMGGNSFSFISKAFRSAIEDSEVEGIVLKIDSPGGTVSGTEALGDLIFSNRDKKPIIAFADGMMASSAYWIGSAADAIVGESTADVGSIGVLMIHKDFSKFDEKIGLKITYLTAGKYKALGNDAEPLGEFARSVFQDELDYIYNIFVQTVARNRGIETEQALEMADGRIFIGQQAVDIGLIDYVGNFNKALELAKVSSGGEIYSLNKGVESMDIKEFKEKHPDLFNEVKEIGFNEAVDVATPETQIREQEVNRVCGLAVVQFGEEAGEKFKSIVDSGVTVDQFKAVQSVNPVKKPDDNQASSAVKKKMLEVISDAGADNPGADQNADISTGKDFMALVGEYMAAHKCSKVVAMKAVMVQHPGKHQAYIKSVN